MKFSQLAVPLLLFSASHIGQSAPHATDFGNVRMAFEANRGQADSTVRYISRGRGYTLLLGDRQAVLTLPRGHREADAIRFEWLGTGRAIIAGEERTGGVSNYLTAGFRETSIPHFNRVRYSGLYRGIDLVYYGVEKQLEYDLVVKPGADPSQAKFRIEGAQAVSLKDGELHIALNGREIRHRKPVVYQSIDGVRRAVPGEYLLLSRNEVGFRLGAYDRSRELVIDPVVAYTAVQGGGTVDEATSIAVDAAGNAYITGYTGSANFPLVAPLRSSFGGLAESFIMKLNPAGNQAQYITFFGGSKEEVIRGIAVDSTGAVYVTGETSSADIFATPAPLRTFSGVVDAFVAKLAPAGNQIVFGTYLGGAADDYGWALALNSANDVYVTGWTKSTNLNGVARADTSTDAFLARINAAGTAITSTVYRGGTGEDLAFAVAVDGSNNVYIAGETTSTNLAGTAIQPSNRGAKDGFIAKWDTNGTSVYWAYFGGNAADVINGIDTDADGNVYIAGKTASTASFPLVNAIQNTLNGMSDAFVAKINPLGTAMIHSTLLGGNFDDEAFAIAVDATRSAFVSGRTTSTVNFPLIGSVKTTSPGGTYDAFVTRVNPAGSAWLYSTLLGGSGADAARSIALDGVSSAYIAGYTLSNELTGSGNNSQQDALVMKIANTCSYTVTPGSLTVTAAGQFRTVTVDTGSDCAWTASAAGGFLSIPGTSSGTGPATIYVSVAANPGVTRTGSLTVAGKTVAVTQTGSATAGCAYTLAASSANVPAAGTNSTVTLTSTGGCAWQAYSNASWLQVFPLSGTGSSGLYYSVYPNFTPSPRSATMVAGGQTFTVNQAANALTADQRFVQLLYFSFFGRLPSTDELNFQVANGLGANKDYASLVMNFLNSQEFNQGGRFVAGLYVGLLDRNAEFGGWQFQRNAFSSGQISPQALVGNFLSGAEYSLRFGNPDNQEFVRLLYRHVLLREPSQAEVNFQATQLQPQGKSTRTDLAISFLGSNEFRQGTGPRLTSFLLYATLLLRGPSTTEMQARMEQLNGATQATIKQIVSEIIQSPEFKGVVGWQ